jgi:hypothetical protein
MVKIKNAIHNLRWGIAILAQFYKVSYIMYVSINKRSRKFSKFLRRSISTLPGKEKAYSHFRSYAACELQVE